MSTARGSALRFSVESTLLATVTFNPENSILDLEFHDGKVYRFFAVPAACFQQLMDADSMGVYFNRYIRNRFRYQQLTESQ